MNKKMVLAALLSIATVFGASAQKLSGDISSLQGEQQVNVVIDFDGTLVNGKAEEKYIADETKRMNATEKEEWLEDWNEKIHSQAAELFAVEVNNNLKNQTFTVGNYPDAEYTINIKVLDITTGFFAAIVNKASALKVEVTFIKKGETAPLATIPYKNVSNAASSYIPYYVTRIVMSFGTLGMNVAAVMNKNLK